MVLNDTWRDAKSTALALHALVTTQFPQDAMQVIGFSNIARVVPPDSLAELDVPGYQGTNLQHALMLAGRFIDKHPDAEPVVLVVTDGEPTAHLTRDGSWSFDWPPSPETLALTLAEVDRLTRRRATLSHLHARRRPAARGVRRRGRAAQRRPGALARRPTGSATTSSATTCASRRGVAPTPR